MPAKKSETSPENVTITEVNASSEKPEVPNEEKLTKEEKTAFEIQQKVAEGASFSGEFKLKDPNTSFSDPDFTLAGDQKKKLPENPSSDLIARIRSGFIVKA